MRRIARYATISQRSNLAKEQAKCNRYFVTPPYFMSHCNDCAEPLSATNSEEEVRSYAYGQAIR